MARTKKDRSAEVEAVFSGLKYCNATQLNEVIETANKLIAKAKEAEIAEKKAQIKALQDEIAKLEK